MQYIKAEPFVAYRAWRKLIEYDSGKPMSVFSLRPMYDEEIFYHPGKTMEAICRIKYKIKNELAEVFDHSTIHRDCACGIHAFCRAEDLMSELRAYVADTNTNLPPVDALAHAQSFIIGEVNMWGRIEVHKDGYRSQYAYPRRFITSLREPQPHINAKSLLDTSSSSLQAYARTWGVDVIAISKISDLKEPINALV